MFTRNIELPQNRSFFLFGPRGTGKTTLIRKMFPKAVYIDLLNDKDYQILLASPEKLIEFIPNKNNQPIIIDEVQKVPNLLNEIHRLIENNKFVFILTGSSARKLARQGQNLLAGRALTYQLHPLSAVELENDFSLDFVLKYGSLPMVFYEENPQAFLHSYVKTYMKEEIIQEGLTRNLSAFARFLQVASFSVGSIVNTTSIAQEVMIDRKVIDSYFSILEELLIGYKLPVFTRRAKRRLTLKPKFYFFDTGIYRSIRELGPLDTDQEISGVALENLFFQNLISINDSLSLYYKFYYYRTVSGTEVDFVAYGEKGFFAFEVKHTKTILPKHLRGLKAFIKVYPEVKPYLIYMGNERRYFGSITALPAKEALLNLDKILTNTNN